MKNRHLIAALAISAVCCPLSQPSAGQGWVKTLPPGMVALDPGRRNPIFYVGEPIQFRVGGTGASSYKVRNYWGRLVDEGSVGATLAVKPEPPGWYKLYVYGPVSHPPYGTVIGGTTFVVFRRREGFPDLPPKEIPGGSYPSMDEPIRGLTGMGPQRLVADASHPDETIQKLKEDVSLDKMFYLNYDPLRNRALMAAFPNGTKNLAGVRKIASYFKNDIQYWEPRNEPNGGSTGAAFVTNELKPFYETIKSVDPGLKVLGPGTVTIGPNAAGLLWIEDFLKAGGARYLDAISFHAYNTLNGDLWMARKGLDSLDALLKKYHADRLEKWQTEQGYFAAMYGAYLPRHQGRWTMLQMMVYEQYGIPKEHNHLWYDRSHGFWDVPTWWENDDGSLNPAAPLMRVWSEELYGTRYAQALDFGVNGNKLFIGSLFSGPTKRVAVLMSAGGTDGGVTLQVTGSSKRLHIVSAFGVESDLPIRNGQAYLPVPEIPVYINLAADQSIAVKPMAWGGNLARASGVTLRASGAGAHPLDPTIPNAIEKIVSGELDNWYWSQQKDRHPWMDDTPGFPAWVELTFPKPQTVARVVVFAPIPWQWDGAPLNYELQAEVAGAWVTLDRVAEPTQTITVLTPTLRTSVDSFYSDRCIFNHRFQPITTLRIRLLVHDVTWGGGASAAVVKAGGQTGPHKLTLRQIEVYQR